MINPTLYTLCMTALCGLLLAGCGPTPPTLINNTPLQEERSQRWHAYMSARYTSHQNVIHRTADLPQHSKQLALGVAQSVYECALTRINNPNEHVAQLVETSCAKTLINDTLIQSGSDRAYEVSLAAKSVSPAWFVSIKPSYVLVD